MIRSPCCDFNSRYTVWYKNGYYVLEVSLRGSLLVLDFVFFFFLFGFPSHEEGGVLLLRCYLMDISTISGNSIIRY